MVVARGWGVGNRCWCLMGKELIGEDERILEVDGGDSCMRECTRCH